MAQITATLGESSSPVSDDSRLFLSSIFTGIVHAAFAVSERDRVPMRSILHENGFLRAACHCRLRQSVDEYCVTPFPSPDHKPCDARALWQLAKARIEGADPRVRKTVAMKAKLHGQAHQVRGKG